MTERFYMGLDLGQASDYSALVIAQQFRDYKGPVPTRYQIRHIERMELGTRYTAIVAHVRDLLWTDALYQKCELVIDATGVGQGVADMFTEGGLHFTGVKIHGGDNVSWDAGEARVPKRDLAAVLQVLYQAEPRRIEVAKSLLLAETLNSELLAFRVKLDPRTAHDSYAAWREGDHDDLVLAAALALWYAETYSGPAAIFIGEEGTYSTDRDDWPSD